MSADRRQRRKNEMIGLILILVGAVLFMLQFVEGPKESIVFFVIGAAFLVAYIQNRRYGLLVPACILIGLGIGNLGEWSRARVGDFDQVGLGIGFILIYVIDRLARGKSHWWPLIPGAILLVDGVSGGSAGLDRVVSTGWPLVLVVIGVLLMLGIGRRSRRSDN